MAHMLVIVDRDRADEWTELALHLVAAAEDPRAARWAGSLHNNSGWARHDAGDYAGALTEFEAALTAHSAHGTAEQQRVAHWAVARALRSTARRRQLVRRVRVRAAGPAAEPRTADHHQGRLVGPTKEGPPIGTADR